MMKGLIYSMDLQEKQLSSDYKYKGRIINLRVDNVLLPNGKEAGREVVEHPGGVCVCALTSENEILFVRQFRYPYKEALLEIPAGKLEKGEDPLKCGKRELLEETGAVGKDYAFLGELYPSPGYCDEIIHMYFARVKSFQDTCPDDDEFLEVEKIPLKEAVRLVMDNVIKDSKTQAAVLKVGQMLS